LQRANNIIAKLVGMRRYLAIKRSTIGGDEEIEAK